jgi:hypothetical protein
MRTPLLIETKVALEAALWHIRDNESVVDLIEDALQSLEAAIEAVNGAKEDAHRMEGRANVDTELLEELA